MRLTFLAHIHNLICLSFHFCCCFFLLIIIEFLLYSIYYCLDFIKSLFYYKFFSYFKYITFFKFIIFGVLYFVLIYLHNMYIHITFCLNFVNFDFIRILYKHYIDIYTSLFCYTLNTKFGIFRQIIIFWHIFHMYLDLTSY